MKKILIVFGTRPEAIKMAPLIKKFENYPDSFQVIVCVTGQHRQMLDQVLNLFEIHPEYDLDIMTQGQDLYDITSKVLIGMRKILKETKPDVVLVHGDTATSTAASLAAFYQQLPVGHIEAGLRTYDIYSPWPEEMNRQITSRIATYHFAPTSLSKENLIKENISEKSILVTGNSVIDALFLVIDMINSNTLLKEDIFSTLKNNGLPERVIKDLRLNREDRISKVVLITGHRRENFGEGFVNICRAIKTLAQQHSNVNFIYPMHLNPNVRKPINEIFGMNKPENVFFIEPLDYLPFVFLMNECTLILTDSGGIQEEAPSLGKPVLVMRNTTERPEAIEAGTVKLVGTNYDLITKETTKLLKDKSYYNIMSKASNPYGDGNSCNRIVEFLK